MPDWTANAALAEEDVMALLSATLHVVISFLDCLMAIVTTLERLLDIFSVISLQIVAVWAGGFKV